MDLIGPTQLKSFFTVHTYTSPEDILKIEQFSNGQDIDVSMESEQHNNQQHAELTSSLILKTLEERFLPEMTDIISNSYRTRKRQRI